MFSRYTNSAMESELSVIKSKISLLEQNIKGPNVPADADRATRLPESTNGYSMPRFGGGSLTFNTTPQLAATPSPNSSVQLPPMNWVPVLGDPVSYRDGVIPGDPVLEKLKYLAKNPYVSSDETISFYDGINSLLLNNFKRRINFGIFSWQAFIVKDRGARLVMKYLSSSKRDMLELVDGKVLAKDTPGNAQEREFKIKAIESTDSSDLIPYKKVSSSSVNSEGSKLSQKIISSTAVSLGLVMNSSIDDELKLADKVLSVLPCKKVVWLLVNKFFMDVYPFMSFFDEESFKSEITRLIGPEDYVLENVEKINVEKRLDYAYIGNLLVMLRLAYLSMFSNRQEVNEENLRSTDTSREAQDTKFLLSNPISIQIVYMAEQCLLQFDLLRKSSFVVLQFMYLLTLYHKFGPEEGEGADGGTALITNGMMIQSAYQMAINREPEAFEEGKDDEKFNNLLRKLWFFMLISDIGQVYQYGTPLAIQPEFYDTRLPFYKKGNENIKDVEMEKDVISTFAYFEGFYIKLVSILKKVINLRQPSRMKDITEMLSDFEMTIYKTFGNIEDFMISFKDDAYRYPFTKIMKCKNLINLTGFVSSMASGFMQNFELKGNMELFIYYLKKVVCVGTLSMVPFYSELICRNHINFGPTADFILNPYLLLYMHKSSQFTLSLILRVNATVHSLKRSTTHSTDMKSYDYQVRFYKYAQLSKYMEAVSKYNITSISRLANRYYYAWRVSKAHNYLLLAHTSNEIYDECDFYEVVKWFQEIPMSDIDELIDMYKGTLDKIKERKYFCPEEIKRRKTQSEPEFNRTSSFSTNLEGVEPSPITSYNDPPNQENSLPSFSSDIEAGYNDMLNNKEVDKLWAQITSDFTKDTKDTKDESKDMSFLEFFSQEKYDDNIWGLYDAFV
ncbi:hypothetical protein PSN45_004246 [Yamadazyma tenuis]|uniref:uncharacterized protein n=1 Tax=Candida tenuis TaxID=2315449 RepID=UPI002799D754|nr:hypothetical protein PSN45_004246 [Yamadazyma tenuis]